MAELITGTLWKQRLSQISSQVTQIRFPESGQYDQDEEWCEVAVDGRTRRIRFHDYEEIFAIPGLYEELFYRRLKCCSPSRVVGLLRDVLSDFDVDAGELRVLDVGAGNGMVGDELQQLGAATIVGIDIIDEAREATFRDRPGVYDDYCIADLTDLPEQQEARLRQVGFNCLTTVAALGYGDIPPAAFLQALDLVSTPGWVAFNIKETFLQDKDSSGFSRLVRELSRTEYLQIQSYRRYRHRVSVTGEPLHYVGVVARKLRDVSDELMDEWK